MSLTLLLVYRHTFAFTPGNTAMSELPEDAYSVQHHGDTFIYRCPPSQPAYQHSRYELIEKLAKLCDPCSLGGELLPGSIGCGVAISQCTRTRTARCGMRVCLLITHSSLVVLIYVKLSLAASFCNVSNI